LTAARRATRIFFSFLRTDFFYLFDQESRVRTIGGGAISIGPWRHATTPAPVRPKPPPPWLNTRPRHAQTHVGSRTAVASLPRSRFLRSHSDRARSTSFQVQQRRVAMANTFGAQGNPPVGGCKRIKPLLVPQSFK
jgi:hypothetical protein